jgi:mono/diheme cytochrome c family protein
MKPQTVAVLVVAATLGLLVVLLLLYGRPRRTRQEPLPTNFSRGDPDAVLEGPRLARVQVWGVATAIFITGFLAVYFVVEPFRQAAYGKKFLAASISRGEEQFRPDASKGQSGANCASCHGANGEGGFAATDASWPAPPLNNEFVRYTRDEITRIVKMGRPGTPMPAWGIEFGGPLSDQKVDDVVNFMESIQVAGNKHWELPRSMTSGKEVFARKCAVCHGADAHGQGLGQPLPTFFAPDLTTEFYRLGLKVSKVNVTQALKNELAAKHAANTDPTPEAVQAAMSKLSAAEIMKAGEEAARNTIMRGRQNTPMPAWQNRIRPEQIDAVIEYLKSIQRQPEA